MCVSSVKKHVISLLLKVSTMKELKQTHALVTKTGLTDHSSVLSKLICFSALSPLGSLEFARSVFKKTAMENGFLCNTMIRAYSQSIFPIEAVHLYNQMQLRVVKSDNFTYSFVLKACSKVLASEDGRRIFIAKKGAELHCKIYQLGLDCDSFVQNSILFMYSQCGSLDLARQVFDQMTEKNVVSWNTMVVAYDRVNDFESADLLLQQIPNKNVVSWNTMITRHVRLGNVEAARTVFERMPEKDSVSWNSLIAGYVQSRNYSWALKLFQEMQSNGVDPTEITIISVLRACAETGALEMGRKIHGFLKQNEYKMEGFLGNALIEMYAKCGSLKFAREVFDEMSMKHVSCWNSMITGLAVHGYCEEALELFSSMEKEQNKVRPNRITFIGVLLACSYKGFVEEGRRFFHCMTEDYNIRPDIKHYGCMVDLLSRWGLLDEAHQMIKSMPFEANCVLWRTLLGACRVHHNVKLAEEAFRKVAELEPLRDGDYVLLSNIFADAERWEDVERVRNKMINLRILKKPGCSQIEMK